MNISKKQVYCTKKLLCMHNNISKNKQKTNMMKKNYYWFFFLLTVWGIQAQDKKKTDYTAFDRKGMKSSILLTDAKLFSVLGKEAKGYSMYDFEEAYQDLKASDTQNRFQNTTSLLSEIKLETTTEDVKIGLIHTSFDVISKKAYEKGLVKIQNHKVIRLSSEDVFDSYTNTIIAPLTTRKKGLKTTFLLDGDFFVNTTNDKIKSIQANFDDGNGFTPITVSEKKTINYASEGTKKIVFELTFENGSKTTKESELQVSYSNEDLTRLFNRIPSLVTATRSPDLAIYGVTDMSPGKCEYEVFRSPDGILDKPIFVIDGFDPTDTRNTTAVYNLLTYRDASGILQNLGDRIRNEEGFDVVIVNFPTYTNAANNLIDGGADFIERNALSLVTVIEMINAQKVGNEQNVIIGPSMGGLISRYALRFMEQNNLNPQTRLWISFDSPHYGANVPIGIQHLFNYFAYGKPNSDAVKPLINNMLRSPAAKQMLVDHFQAHITTGANTVFPDNTTLPNTGLPLTPTGYPGYRDNFQNRMNAMGFPTSTRNISMINGSGNLARYKAKDGTTDITPGFDFIGTSTAPYTIDLGTIMLWVSARAKTFCEFMPTANTQERIVDVTVEYNPLFFYTTYDTFKVNAKQSTTTDGVDSAPAGLFDMGGLASSLGTGNATLTNFLNAMKADKFSFIPAVSAMGLNVGGVIANNQPNYYYNINLGARDTPWDGITTTTSNTTPFKNWYMPATNENHVTVTQGNVDFSWCEIVKPDLDFTTTSASSVSTCNGNTATFTFSNNVHGCVNPISFTASGNPAGSIVSFSPATISADGNVTMTLSNVSPGTYNITVTPSGFASKAKVVTVTIYPSNPNLNGTTQYSVNADVNYTTASSVTVSQGANVRFRIPSNLYNGTIEWFDPTGLSRGSADPEINNIQDNSNDEGTWQAKITFTHDCARLAPVSIPFQVNVQPALGTETTLFEGLKVYPNPTTGTVSIHSGQLLGEVTFEIIDVRGRVLLSQQENKMSLESQIDLTNLSQGTYFLRITKENDHTILPILKN